MKLYCCSSSEPSSLTRDRLFSILIALICWFFGGGNLPSAAQTLTTLTNFDYTNGATPLAGLIQGSDGNFYGTTAVGGTAYGTVFRITPSGILTTLASFNLTNGGNPVAGLIEGSDGNFYGTTNRGGTGGTFNPYGYGTVFRVSPSGVLTTLVNFNITNGAYPSASLVQGTDGNFYGTSSEGGSSNLGTVFRVTPSGEITTLVNFSGSNGSYPYAALVQGSDGNFYGTT